MCDATKLHKATHCVDLLYNQMIFIPTFNLPDWMQSDAGFI